MSNANHVESAARLAASLALVFMVSASAQTTGSGAATNGKAAAPSTRDSASSSQTSKASKIDDLTRSDRAFMTKAAQGGLAEVELGRIAAQKATVRR